MAGLPGSGVSVLVGPPLCRSGPRTGLVEFRSVDLAKPHEVPLSRLYPANSVGAAPVQLAPPVEPATMVPVSWTSGQDRSSPVEFPVIVVYETVPLPQA